MGPFGLPVVPEERDKTSGRVPPDAYCISGVWLSTEVCHSSLIAINLKSFNFLSGNPMTSETLKNVQTFIISSSAQRQSMGKITAPRRANAKSTIK